MSNAQMHFLLVTTGESHDFDHCMELDLCYQIFNAWIQPTCVFRSFGAYCIISLCSVSDRKHSPETSRIIFLRKTMLLLPDLVLL